MNVIFPEGPGTAGAPMLSVRLTAAPGYEVDLYGFDLAGFGVDYVIAGVSVFAEATTLFSETNVLVQGDATAPLHTTFAFATPLSAPELLVQPLDKTLQPKGKVLVAADATRMAAPGELVAYEGGREAALALEQTFVPVDHAIISIVDAVNVTGGGR